MLLSAQHVLTQGLRLVRNIIVARILTPGDFGIAATFWITTGFLAMISELGLNQLLIQAREGDDEDFGATIQSIVLIRGLLIATVILFLAEPLAAMFRAPETAWAFRLLAILPILSGLRHRDMERLKRSLRFWPHIGSRLGPQVLVTMAAWPVASYVGNYAAFVWLSIMGGILGVLLSHLLADRPFRLRWDWVVVRQALNFGWPLLLNGLLMYAALQGDRVILSQSYTKAELGLYSIAVGLAMAPCGILGGITAQLMLPLLSRAQDDRRAFHRHYRLFAQLAAATGLVIGVLFLLLGPALIQVLYGPRYGMAGAVIGWLAAAQSLRLVRHATTTAAMALGDTRNSLVANLFRQIALVLALIAAASHAPLSWIAVTGVAGELAALSASTGWLRWRHRLPARSSLIPGAILTGGLLLSAWIGLFKIGRTSLLAASFTSVVAVGASSVLTLIVFPELRNQVFALVGPTLGRLGLAYR